MGHQISSFSTSSMKSCKCCTMGWHKFWRSIFVYIFIHVRFHEIIVVIWALKLQINISWMETYWNDPSEFFSTHCVLVANRSFSPHLLKSPLYFCFRPSCSLFSREMYVGQSRRDRINITIHFDILSYCYLLLALTELPTPDGAVGICSSIVN